MMRARINTFLIFLSLGCTLGHNWIPHHHHHDEDVMPGEVHRHHQDGEDHDHPAFTFLHVDEAFLVKAHVLKALECIPTPYLSLRSVTLESAQCTALYDDHPHFRKKAFPGFIPDLHFRGPPRA